MTTYQHIDSNDEWIVDDFGNMVGVRARIDGAVSADKHFVFGEKNPVTGGIRATVAGQDLMQGMGYTGPANPVQIGNARAAEWSAASLVNKTGGATALATLENGFQIGAVSPLKVVQGSSGVGACVMQFASDIDMSGAQHLSVGFRFDNNIAAAGCNNFNVIFYYADGTFTTYNVLCSMFAPGINHVVNIQRFKPDGTLANYGGTDYFDSKLVRSAGVLTGATSAQAVGSNVWMSFLGHGLARKSRFMVSLDGGYIGQKTIALPILQEYGIKATFYVQKYQLGQAGRISQSDLDLIYSLGHDVAMHSYSKDADFTNTTTWPTVTLQADITAELLAFRSWAAGRGYTRALDHYCAAIANPFDSSVGTQTLGRMQSVIAALQSAGAKTYRQGFPLNVYCTHTNPALSEKAIDVFINQMNSASPGTAGIDINSGAEARGQVQLAARMGLTKMVYGHDFALSGASGTSTTNRDTFYQLCDEIAEQSAKGKMQNITVSQI